MVEQGQARSALRLLIAVLSAVLNRAVDEEILARNPAHEALPRGRQDKHGKVNPFTPEQLSHLLVTAAQAYPKHVDISQQLTDRLRARFQPGDEPTNWVFSNRVGNILDTDNFRAHYWHTLINIAALGHRQIKDLRHTYASMIFAGNLPLPYIQAQLGHHSIQMTADAYGHLIPDQHQYKLEAIDAIIGAAG